MTFHLPCVYFFEAEGALCDNCIPGKFLVKIGYTRNPVRRYLHTSTYCPYPIRALLIDPGDKQTERYYHDAFASRRVRGEWFVLLRTEIADLLESREHARFRDAWDEFSFSKVVKTYPGFPKAQCIECKDIRSFRNDKHDPPGQHWCVTCERDTLHLLIPNNDED